MALEQPMQNRPPRALETKPKQGRVARFFRELAEIGGNPESLVLAGSLLLASAAAIANSRNSDGKTLTNKYKLIQKPIQGGNMFVFQAGAMKTAKKMEMEVWNPIWTGRIFRNGVPIDGTFTRLDSANVGRIEAKVGDELLNAKRVVYYPRIGFPGGVQQFADTSGQGTNYIQVNSIKVAGIDSLWTPLQQSRNYPYLDLEGQPAAITGSAVKLMTKDVGPLTAYRGGARTDVDSLLFVSKPTTGDFVVLFSDSTGFKQADSTKVNLPPTGVREESPVPATFGLKQNYPNPFNPTTTIEYELKKASTVTIKVYDVLGQEVGVVVEGKKQGAGNYKVEFNAAGRPSGIYFARMTAQEAPDEVSVTKMVLVK